MIQLDHIPATWEEKTSLYCAFLFDEGYQSSTIKSYTSAIKHKLLADQYQWDDNLVLLSTIVKACKLENDTILTRLPIKIKLLEALVFELLRSDEWGEFQKQLYKTLFLTQYYGLMRIGEVTQGIHTLRATDVYLGQNRSGVALYLYTSKTHGRRDRPQRIIINNVGPKQKRLFNPVEEIATYSEMRPPYRFENEQYFFFEDRSPVTASKVRGVLRKLLRQMDLEDHLYDTHSFRIGAATDMFQKGTSVEKIKEAGRWKSNAIYCYLRNQ